MAALRIGFRAMVEATVAVIVLLLGWEYGAPAAGVPEYVLPLPSVIATTFGRSLP